MTTNAQSDALLALPTKWREMARDMAHRHGEADDMACALRACANELADALASSPAPVGEAWQPIETAPKDRAILVIGGTWHDDTSHTGNEYPLRDWALASWRSGWWIGYGETAGAECWAMPTHWHELPAMSSRPEGQGGES